MADLDRETLDKDTQTALAAAEKEHGELGKKIALIVTDEGAVIVRRPARQNVSKFMDASKFTSDAMEALVRPFIVYPSKEAFSRLLDEQPAALTIIASEALTLAGAGAKALTGK